MGDKTRGKNPRAIHQKQPHNTHTQKNHQNPTVAKKTKHTNNKTNQPPKKQTTTTKKKKTMRKGFETEKADMED